MRLRNAPLQPDQLTDDRRAPLAFAVSHGRDRLIIAWGTAAVATGDVETIKMLLRQGAVLLAAPADVLGELEGML
jgi:hypothetical protein